MSNNIITPLLNPQTQAEQLFNETHIRTRNSIERLIGTWKRRFPVLAYGMKVKLETALNIIVATGVLQNIAIDNKDGDPPLPEELNEDHFNYLLETGNIPNLGGHDQVNATNPNIGNGAFTRNLLINNYFNNFI